MTFVENWQGPQFVMWLTMLVFFFFCFVSPLLSIRRKLRKKKEADSRSLRDAIRELQGEYASTDISPDQSALLEKISGLSERLWRTENMTLWPMDRKTLQQYGLLLASEIAPAFWQLGKILS